MIIYRSFSLSLSLDLSLAHTHTHTYVQPRSLHSAYKAFDDESMVNQKEDSTPVIPEGDEATNSLDGTVEASVQSSPLKHSLEELGLVAPISMRRSKSSSFFEGIDAVESDSYSQSMEKTLEHLSSSTLDGVFQDQNASIHPGLNLGTDEARDDHMYADRKMAALPPQQPTLDMPTTPDLARVLSEAKTLKRRGSRRRSHLSNLRVLTRQLSTQSFLSNVSSVTNPTPFNGPPAAPAAATRSSSMPVESDFRQSRFFSRSNSSSSASADFATPGSEQNAFASNNLNDEASMTNTPVPTTTTSAGSRSTGSISSFHSLDGKVRRKRVSIVAPAGRKLGLTIESSRGRKGPRIIKIKDRSPLAGMLMVGDQIVQVANVGTMRLNSNQVSRLLAGQTEPFRVVVTRRTMGTDRDVDEIGTLSVP